MRLMILLCFLTCPLNSQLKYALSLGPTAPCDLGFLSFFLIFLSCLTNVQLKSASSLGFAFEIVALIGSGLLQ